MSSQRQSHYLQLFSLGFLEVIDGVLYANEGGCEQRKFKDPHLTLL